MWELLKQSENNGIYMLLQIHQRRVGNLSTYGEFWRCGRKIGILLVFNDRLKKRKLEEKFKVRRLALVEGQLLARKYI